MWEKSKQGKSERKTIFCEILAEKNIFLSIEPLDCKQLKCKSYANDRIEFCIIHITFQIRLSDFKLIKNKKNLENTQFNKLFNKNEKFSDSYLKKQRGLKKKLLAS